MKRLLWHLFIGWTLSGLALLFLDRGSFDWWDKVWVVLFAMAAYAGIAGWAGISPARACASIVLVSFAAAIATVKLTLPTLYFTQQAGPGVAGLFPISLVLLLFATLSVSERAAAAVFPYSERVAHAAWTTMGFALTAVNATTFLAKTRFWWVWNPAGNGWLDAGIMTALLAAVAFGLSFVFPVDSRMRLTRWSVEVTAFLALNALFLASRFAIPLAGR